MLHRCLVLCLLMLCSLTAAAELPESTLPPDRKVSYFTDIAPLLQQNCVACHRKGDDEGGVMLESVDAMKTSDNDEVLLPSKPEESRLFVAATHGDDLEMPPAKNGVGAKNLTPQQLALLRRWIAQGAIDDTPKEDPSKNNWQPLPTSNRTSFAATMHPNRPLKAISFGNRVGLFLGDKMVTELRRPQTTADALPQSNRNSSPAQRDFVHAIDFDPHSNLIATAGYREVALWKYEPLQAVTLPSTPHNVIALATSARNHHIAVLTADHSVHVGTIGNQAFQWSGNSQLNVTDEKSIPKLALSPKANWAAIGHQQALHVLSADGVKSKLNTPAIITCCIATSENELVLGFQDGRIQVIGMAPQDTLTDPIKVSANPIQHLIATPTWLAIDNTGLVRSADQITGTWENFVKLPAPATDTSLSVDDNKLFVVLGGSKTGTLGSIDLTSKQFQELAVHDPAAQAIAANAKWQFDVGTKQSLALTAEKNQTASDAKAEQNSLDSLIKKTDDYVKQQETAKQALEKAQQADETALKTLQEKQALQNDVNQNRQTLTKQIAGLTTDDQAEQKATLQQQLAKLTSEADLAKQVKTAMDAQTKTASDLESKQKALKQAEGKVVLAKADRGRMEKRLSRFKELEQTLADQLAEEKARQSERQEQMTASQTAATQSRAATNRIAVVSTPGIKGQTHLASFSTTAEAITLWPGKQALPTIPLAGKLIELSQTETHLIGVLETSTAPNETQTELLAWKLQASPWQLAKRLGASQPNPLVDRVLCLAIDPSGKRLATGGGQPSREGELLIWNLETGQIETRIEQPHADTVLCLDFSPDGSRLATGSADGLVKVWEVASGALLQTFEGHTHHVTAIDWRVDQREISSAASDAIIKVWNLSTGKASRTITGLKAEVTSLRYLGIDNRIAITDGDGYVRIYRTDNGARELNTKPSSNYLYALETSQSGDRILAADSEGQAVEIDRKGKVLHRHELIDAPVASQ
ncbi:WD domain, G-beta repeat [Stieleria bergensis]|uniref:WD domain, G-beta repeat n=2 Tax=Stieleria bergensis TaxID=2528025 RepID=A0A517SPY7_9BACT|nr:WD domain, G-beta repeat [Planctomycetes bacterium SV_7m_r]